METVIRWMRAEDEWRVRELYALGHPAWPTRQSEWFFAYPTLVVFHGEHLAGFTSFSLGSLTGLLMVQGQDVVVDPAAQGLGLGLRLHRARLDAGANVGATLFSGITTDDNVPMQRIFQACGHHRCQVIRRYYPDGADGAVWSGAVTG